MTMTMLIVIVLVVVIQSNAYVHSARPSTQLNQLKKSQNSNTRLSLSPAVTLVAAKGAATLPIIYCLMSLNEYITHRFYQHAEINKIAKLVGLNFKIRGGGHVEHHAETKDDMTLKTDDEAWTKTPAYKLLSDDKYRGTAFSWKVFWLMTLQMFVSTVPLFKYVLGFSMNVTLSILMPAMLIYASAWNTLHPSMHGLPDNNIKEGPPSKLLSAFKNSKYFRMLEINHVGHHIMPCNYNVCAPGADYIFGTHVDESVWRKKQKIEDRTAQTSIAPKQSVLAL